MNISAGLLLSATTVLLITCAGRSLREIPAKTIPSRDRTTAGCRYLINEKLFVTIGGIRQGMFLRGCDPDKPVLLFLHGGPGMPTYFLTRKFPTGLENEFIVCYWEQRGAGLSFSPALDPRTITVDNLAGDAVEVAEYLRKRFGRNRIFLMGHSWGSLLGIRAAARAPELFTAYIGVAQISRQDESEQLALAYMIRRYRSCGNRRMAGRLSRWYGRTASGTDIRYFRSPLRDRAMHELGIGTTHAMRSVITGIFLPLMRCNAYTFSERVTIWRAKRFLTTRTSLIGELLSADLPAEVHTLQIPVYFMSGIHDYTVNYSLSKSFFSRLQAPVKGFYSFSRSAHCPMHEEPERFMQILRKDVLSGTCAGTDNL